MSKVDYEFCLSGYHWYKMFSASSEEEVFEAYEEYLKFLRNRYGFEFENNVDIGTIQEVDPSELVGLSTIERLNKEELNAQHPEHALMMMNPEFTMDQLREQGTSLYKRTYRDLMLKEVHPDKVKGEGVESAAVRLNVAKEILDNWVQKNT